MRHEETFIEQVRQLLRDNTVMTSNDHGLTLSIDGRTVGEIPPNAVRQLTKEPARLETSVMPNGSASRILGPCCLRYRDSRHFDLQLEGEAICSINLEPIIARTQGEQTDPARFDTGDFINEQGRWMEDCREQDVPAEPGVPQLESLTRHWLRAVLEQGFISCMDPGGKLTDFQILVHASDRLRGIEIVLGKSAMNELETELEREFEQVHGLSWWIFRNGSAMDHRHMAFAHSALYDDSLADYITHVARNVEKRTIDAQNAEDEPTDEYLESVHRQFLESSGRVVPEF